MICKKEGLQLLESYDYLRDFVHDNAISLLDYYTQGGKFGRLIVPKMQLSFQSWFFKEGGRSLLFDERDHMTSIFEKLMLEYCDLIESLLLLDLILENFDLRNMYVDIFDGVPTLRVLLTNVKKVPFVGPHRRDTWDCARKFMSWCEDQCSIKRDNLTEKFCAFLGKSNCTVAKLKRYPHNWDDSVKGEYLIALVGSDHKNMQEMKVLVSPVQIWFLAQKKRSLLEGSDLTWPFPVGLPRRPDSLPQLLQDILSWDQDERYKSHNVSDFFSYLILLRNCYKHFDDLPNKIKNMLKSRKALIALIERWTPYFWILVYEAIGRP